MALEFGPDLTETQKVEQAEANDLWLNAFACVAPSPEFLQSLGKAVLDTLNASPTKDRVLGVEIGSVAYIRVRKS